MNVCNNKCEKYRFKRKGMKSIYESGGKGCRCCNILIKYDGLRCPCCSSKLRTKPIDRKAKMRIKIPRY